MSEINDFLTEAGVFFLSTMNALQPKCRPLGLHLEVDNKILFGIGNYKDVYKQINRNTRVEIVAYKPDGHWLRYTGRAVFETDDKYAELALEEDPNLREIYNEDTGYKLKMFHLEKAKAVIIPTMGEGVTILDETGLPGSEIYYSKEERASKVLHDGLLDAEATLKDKPKIDHLLQRLEKKVKVVPVIGGALADVPIMMSLVYNYVNKKYTEVPIGSIIAIISALTYFISPVDLIPDIVPGMGYIDDGAVVAACLKLVDSDIKEYQNWRRAKGLDENYTENFAYLTDENEEIFSEETTEIL